MPAYSLVKACMLDSKGVGWHQAPGWFHLKCIINCFEEKIWCLNCLCVVVDFCSCTGFFKAIYHIDKYCAKRILVPCTLFRLIPYMYAVCFIALHYRPYEVTIPLGWASEGDRAPQFRQKILLFLRCHLTVPHGSGQSRVMSSAFWDVLSYSVNGAYSVSDFEKCTTLFRYFSLLCYLEPQSNGLAPSGNKPLHEV